MEPPTETRGNVSKVFAPIREACNKIKCVAVIAWKFVFRKSKNKLNVEKLEALSLNDEPYDEPPFENLDIENSRSIETVGEPSTRLAEKNTQLSIDFSTKKLIEKSSNTFPKSLVIGASTSPDYEPSDADLNTEETFPEYNILLLGETGTGKSTTINAIANYLKFGSLEEANKHTFVELVSSKFSLSHPETGEEFPVISGNDVNENESEESGAQSRTQSPVAYRFQYDDRILRIIDTPGMGDTRGLKVDKENFDKILRHLHAYRKLHGVVILLKANVTRELASFRYCLTELLDHLHKGASENIIFCFTFARNTFYAPGDGFMLLKRFLAAEFPRINLNFGQNSFFIDNEAYRYLVAKKAGYPFQTAQAESFAESWSKSANQVSKMISTIMTLKAHNLENTFALNMAQNLLCQLAQPMVQLQKSIHSNLKILQTQKAELEQNTADCTATKKALATAVHKVVIVHLKMPNTVCTAEKCISVINLNGRNIFHYKTVCCKNCPEKSIQNLKLGNPLLQYCEAFFHGDSTNCQFCGCSWKVHAHLRAEYKFIEKPLIEKEEIRQLTEELLNSSETNKSVSNKIIQTLKVSIKEYNEEMGIIQKVVAYFGYLLDEHSNSSFNSFIEPYLDLLIAEEEVKIRSISGYQDDTRKLLVELKSTQKNNVERVAEKVKCGRLELDFSYMMDIIGMLTKLKHNGQQFQGIVDEFIQNSNIKVENEERFGGSFSATAN